MTPLECLNSHDHCFAVTLISTACVGGVTTRTYDFQPYQNRNTVMSVGITVHVISSASLCAVDGSGMRPGLWRYLIVK